MNRTLIIENVDFQELDRQRKVLSGLVCYALPEGITKSDELALDGIVNMLDSWADKLWKEGRLGIPHPDNPQHVENLLTIDMLERQGFTGVDASLRESLFEYGFAWREIPEDLRDPSGDRWLIIFRKDTGNNPREFDRMTMGDPDMRKEYDWVDWEDFLGSMGIDSYGEWDQGETPEKFYDLFLQYGWMNVFGSDPYTFEIRDPDHCYGSNPAPGEDPDQYYSRLLHGEEDGSGEPVIATDFIRTETGAWFVSGGGNCFGGQLHQWHSGMDRIYAAGSLVAANREVPLELLGEAIDLLQHSVDSDGPDLADSETWQFSKRHGEALLVVMRAALAAEPSEHPQYAEE